MITFCKDYIYVDGKVYKELKPDTSRKILRWHITDKQGKRRWITKDMLEQIIAKKLAK